MPPRPQPLRSLVAEKEKRPGDDLLSEVGTCPRTGRQYLCSVQRRSGRGTCRSCPRTPSAGCAGPPRKCRRSGAISLPLASLPPSFILPLLQVIQNDLKNGNISRDQLIAHAFLLVVRPGLPSCSPAPAWLSPKPRHPVQSAARLPGSDEALPENEGSWFR